jgi:hypothetical protein
MNVLKLFKTLLKLNYGIQKMRFNKFLVNIWTFNDVQSNNI